MLQNNDEMHPADKRNLVIFIIAALLLWYGFDTFLLQPRLAQMEQARQEMAEKDGGAALTQERASLEPFDKPGQEGASATVRERSSVIAENPRVKIDTPSVSGSLSLVGGRIDDLTLHNYYRTLDKKKPVTLLSPAGTGEAKYVEMGWMPADKDIAVPDTKTRWRVRGNDVLSTDSPVTLIWDNGQGLQFERRYEIDKNYLFTVTQRVLNRTMKPVALFPYALITQQGYGDVQGSRVGMEGLIGYFNGDLEERAYAKMRKEPRQEFEAVDGWAGISQQYWFTSLIPDQTGAKTFRFVQVPGDTKKDPGKFQVDYVGGGMEVAPGEASETVTRVYAGAKKLELLEQYEEALGIEHFDLAIDFGLWYFLTKPIFHTLIFLANLTGNFGIAIIILTIMMRVAVFPLANKSYRSFAKMKHLSPKMKELRELYGDDKAKLQQELVALYEREKVNPMAGCFPIIIQIPIFFALFKVLSISLEMRHAPFFGWIQDLSAKDPTSVFNLFGLIPWQPPEPMVIGIWPCLMFLAMLVQRKMNPPPQDPTQAMMMNMMPFFMTYILSRFAAGLVIYWTFSNILSAVQQYIIMRSMGVEVHLFSRSKEDKEMAEMVKAGPVIHPELEVLEDEMEDALFGEHEEAGKEDKPEKPITPPKRKSSKKKKKK